MVIANEKRYDNIPEMLKDYWVNHLRFIGKELFANINDLYIDVNLPKTHEHLFNAQYVYDTAKWIKECKDKDISPKEIYRSLQKTLGQYINFGVDFFTHYYKQANLIIHIYENHEFHNYYLPLAIERDVQSDYPVELSQVQPEPIKPVNVEGLKDLSGIGALRGVDETYAKQSSPYTTYKYEHDVQFRTKPESESIDEVKVETDESVESFKHEVILPVEITPSKTTPPETVSDEPSTPVKKTLKPEEVLSQLDKTKFGPVHEMNFVNFHKHQENNELDEVHEVKEEVPPSQGETLLLEETHDETSSNEVEEAPVTFDENDYLVYDQNNVQLRYSELLTAKGIAMDHHDDKMVNQLKFVMNSRDGNGHVLLNYISRGFVSVIKQINNQEYYKSEGEVDGIE